MTSPFITGTQIQYAWDSTSLGWLKECPRKYYYSMIEGYRPKAEAVNLKFGLLYHEGLEYYDRQRAKGGEHEAALLATVKYLMEETWEGTGPWVSDHNAKTRETLIRSVIWYIDQFGKEDPAQTIVLADGKPAVELSFKMELNWGPPYLLCGHLDRVVTFTGGTYVMDRKTTSTTLSPNYFEQYSPDNQMSLYTMASKVIYKTPVQGIIIDAAQIAVGFTRFSRGFAYRTDAEVEEWIDELKFWFALQEQLAKAKKWPMNDRSCHKYGGCHFRKVCSKSPDIRHVFLESDFVKVPWNPLVPR